MDTHFISSSCIAKTFMHYIRTAQKYAPHVICMRRVCIADAARTGPNIFFVVLSPRHVLGRFLHLNVT